MESLSLEPTLCKPLINRSLYFIKHSAAGRAFTEAGITRGCGHLRARDGFWFGSAEVEVSVGQPGRTSAWQTLI